jgi:hypothetical protein
MIDLHDELRAAAEAPPPSRIDLDALIDREVRRRRTLRWAGAAATFGAVAALAIAVPIALGGGPASYSGADVAAGRPCPTVAAPGPQQSHAAPRPTEHCGDAVARLGNELSAAITRVLPTMQPGPVEFAYVPVRLGYEATVRLTGPKSEDVLRVELIASHEHPGRAGAGCLVRCDYTRDPDGTIIAATQSEQQRQVVAYRPDGTTLLLLAYPSSRVQVGPAVTLAQVAAIARTPGLTLFPKAQPAPVAAPTTPPVAPQDATAARLSDALGAQLAAALPGATLTDPNAPAGGPAPWFTGSRDSAYKAGVDIADAEGVSHLYASLLATRPPCAEPPTCERPPTCPMVDDGTRCEVAPDGTKQLVMWATDGGFRTYQIELHRPDGSIVQLSLTNFAPASGGDATGAIACSARGECKSQPEMTVTRTTLPLTTDQLVEIGNALRL